jgi:hypothetical protein
VSEWWKQPHDAIEEKNYLNYGGVRHFRCLNPKKKLSQQDIEKLNLELMEGYHGKDEKKDGQ